MILIGRLVERMVEHAVPEPGGDRLSKKVVTSESDPFSAQRARVRKLGVDPSTLPRREGNCGHPIGRSRAKLEMTGLSEVMTKSTN